MNKLNRVEYATIAMIGILAASRLIPHWPNFTPVMAIALMGGAALGSIRTAFLVPIAAMIASDVALGAIFGWEYTLHATQLFVYGSVILVTFLGRFVRSSSTPMQIFGGGSVAAVAFFTITNAAVWLTGTMYPPTFSGLLMSFEAGLAFYRDGGNFFLNGLASTWLFSSVIVAASSYVGRTANSHAVTD